MSGTTLGSRFVWASIAGVLVALAGLLMFHDSPKVFGQGGTSSDATLSGLTLSGIDFGTFDPGTLQYTAQAASSVTQTTVTPSLNHSGASYAIKHGGVTDEDGTIALSVGSNGITVEVTAEDGQTMRTYSVTVTRPASSDATIEWLDLSGIDIGDGSRGTYVGSQTSFNASVYHSISQTTVTLTLNHPGASYVVKLGGVEDADRSISLAVGSNVITIEVTAEDGQTTKTYTATVNRATASAPTTGELSTDAPPVNFRAIYVSKTFAGFALSFPRNRGLFGSVEQRYEHDGDSFVSSGADSRYEFSDTDDLGGSRLEFGDENVEPGALYKWVAMLTNRQGSTVIEVSVTVRIPPDETTELSSDATLSDLTLTGLTGIELRKTGGLHGVVEGFESYALSYAASVGNSVSQATVVPTVNDSGATYVVKLGGVTDADGVVALSVGSNIITVEVTAEDGEATQTYTVAVTRAAALSTDATLSSLTLSGIDFGTFDSDTLQYTVQVGSHVDQTVVTVTRNHSRATYLVKLGGVTETDGVVSLSAGSNVITVEVTAEDGQTMRTYSVTVTRPVSDNAHLIYLTLSGIAIEHGSTFYPPGFSPLVFNYAPSVAHSLTETTVTPTVAHSFATYIIKLDGVTDADRVIALSVGRNVITIEVTAEDGETTKTYTITVTRAPAPMTDATLKSLLLSGIDIGSGMGIGKIVPTDTSYTASVYHSVSQTTVTPTVNHSGASYVIKLGGVEDADGTISLAVGSNVITVEVTAEDDSTTKTYTVTVNRATAAASTTGELSTDDPPVNFRATDVFSDHTIIVLSFPRNRGITGWVLQRYEHDGDEFVSSGSAMRSEFTGSKDLGGEGLRVGNSEVEPGALYKWVAQLTNSQGSTVIETSLTVRIPSDETTELSTDATLSGLTLSEVDFGTFASGTTSYAASVGNSVSQATVVPTVNDSGATYVVKLGGVTDADGVVALSVGSNIITVEVTAEDGEATQTYTVAVTRAAALSTDATLSALTLSDIGFGAFASGTTSYTASVANSVSQTTVTPTVNDSGATYVIKLGGVTDADGIVPLSVGSNVVTVVVTAEDGSTTQTYTVTVTREGLPIEETEAETEQRLRVQYDANENGAIDRDEVLTAINDYLFDGLLAKDEVLVVINLYLFG